jgi:hypothetical protein
MPTFTNSIVSSAIVPEGAHLCKVSKAVKKVSKSNNEMIVLQLEIPDARKLKAWLVFTPKMGWFINSFCESAELTRPRDEDAEILLEPKHCLGRYCYVSVKHEEDENGEPRAKVTRFLTREEAITRNPELQKIQRHPQSPVELPVVQPISAPARPPRNPDLDAEPDDIPF